MALSNVAPYAYPESRVPKLREETGYVGEVVRVTERPIVLSPGLTDEKLHIATVYVDLSRPENAPPLPAPAEPELICPRLLPLAGLSDALRASRGTPAEGLHLLAAGLDVFSNVERLG